MIRVRQFMSMLKIVIEWPSDRVTKWPSDRVTGSFADDWPYGIFLVSSSINIRLEERYAGVTWRGWSGSGRWRRPPAPPACTRWPGSPRRAAEGRTTVSLYPTHHCHHSSPAFLCPAPARRTVTITLTGLNIEYLLSIHCPIAGRYLSLPGNKICK